jgi:hypothetical protein
MLSSAIVMSLSSSVLYFQRREDDAVAVFVHGLTAAVTPSLGTRPEPATFSLEGLKRLGAAAPCLEARAKRVQLSCRDHARCRPGQAAGQHGYAPQLPTPIGRCFRRGERIAAIRYPNAWPMSARC